MATFSEMAFLARMYKENMGNGEWGTEKYLEGVLRGIDFLLYLQYPNGCWPQCDPAKQGYFSQITYNDGAMLNAMKVMREVYEARPPYDIPIPAETRAKCLKAFQKGLICILKTQVRKDGKPTVWCQQHDKETLKPCYGRAFEFVRDYEDTWENPANWSNGAPDIEDTVVFAKDARIVTRISDPYECGRLVLKKGANVTLQSAKESNGAINPKLRPGKIEGNGTITLNRFGLETREGATLRIPASVGIVADPNEGRGSWLCAPERGRMIVEGPVSCPGNRLNVFWDVTLKGKLSDRARMDIDRNVVIENELSL